MAAKSRVDAVKFQSFKTENLVTPDAPKAEYQKRTTDPADTHFEMLRRLELSPDAHRELMGYCREMGILFMSSAFDEESADLLSDLGVSIYKIPSGEITNLPLLDRIARKGKPMIVSTGMADLGEVEQAVRTIHEAGNRDIVLLQCVSNYPADPADVNLRAMHTMAAAFNVPVGFSDHTMGIEVPLAAVALGASVIEKHFTLDRTLPGPDHVASVEPDELTSMVKGIRKVESALGHGRKEPAASEANTASVARKSLVAAHHIAAGTTLTEDLIAIKRPGTGLPPAMRPHLAGRRVREDVQAGALLTLEMLV
jgi:N-acetylneuraminate synthase